MQSDELIVTGTVSSFTLSFIARALKFCILVNPRNVQTKSLGYYSSSSCAQYIAIGSDIPDILEKEIS